MARALPVLALPWLVAWTGLSLLALLKRGLRRWLYAAARTEADLRAISWQQFEWLVGEYFRRQGFEVRETGSPAGDGGVDLLLFRNGEGHVVQCKHWKSRQVGVQVVRELVGTVQLTGAASGYLVSSGRLTSAATAAAREGAVRLVPASDILAAGSDGPATGVAASLRRFVPRGERTRTATRWIVAGAAVVLLLAAGVLVMRFGPEYAAGLVEAPAPSGNAGRPGAKALPRHGSASQPPVEVDTDRLRSTGPGNIYSWRDAAGNLHFGDSPPDGARDVRRIQEPLEERNVVDSSGR
jgi:hypothetical protein